MPNIEVDQSGRMEMSGDTTVAASDGFTVTVRITAKVKREVQGALLAQGVKSKLVHDPHIRRSYPVGYPGPSN